MARCAHFRVHGVALDGGGGAQVGTVTIDRDFLQTFAVRVLRRRRRYTMPLNYVAAMVVRAILFQEAAEKRAAKRAAKKGRRRA